MNADKRKWGTNKKETKRKSAFICVYPRTFLFYFVLIRDSSTFIGVHVRIQMPFGDNVRRTGSLHLSATVVL